MFELPEIINLAKQVNDIIKGKTVQRGQLGNSPHKFVWYNKSHEEFERLTKKKTVGEARAKGKWLFIPLEPGYVLLLGEFGGKMLYHVPGSKVPKKYHMHLMFDDNSFLTVTTQMWGAVELYKKGEENNNHYVKTMRTTPTEAGFTFDYFESILNDLKAGEKRSAKSLLTQDQIIPGLGNAIVQDILFRAGLHPGHPIADLDTAQRRILYNAVINTVSEVTDRGGRYDEYDLYNNQGGYIRIMDKNAVGRPCPQCRGEVKKIQYLGGACYFCPDCQK